MTAGTLEIIDGPKALRQCVPPLTAGCSGTVAEMIHQPRPT